MPAKSDKAFLEFAARMRAANAMVTKDPEILGGTPVIKGTRVPVHDVAASVKKGIPMEDILAAYPSITQEQAQLAVLYVTVNEASKDV